MSIIADKICKYCHGTGDAYKAMQDIKKGECGWFEVIPCPGCRPEDFERVTGMKPNLELLEQTNETYNNQTC